MKRMLLVLVVAASLALSACGSSPAAKKAALKSYVASLGASPTLQVTLVGSFSGAKAAKVEKVLQVLTFGMNFSSTTGNAISQSASDVNWEVTANVSGTPFVDLRDVDNNIYFNVDVTQFSKIPGIHFSSAELSGIQLLFGGRWFELPESFLNSILPKKDAAGAQAAESKTMEAKVIDAVTNLIATTPATSTSTGYTESGTILSLAKALLAGIPSLGKDGLPNQSNAKGTFTLGVSISGSNATGASVSITEPNAKATPATATLTATFAHASTTVSVPTGATVITAAMLKSFGASKF